MVSSLLFNILEPKPLIVLKLESEDLKMDMSVVHHVLSTFDKDDYIGILQSIDKVDDAVNHYLQEKNFEKTMQRYNG